MDNQRAEYVKQNGHQRTSADVNDALWNKALRENPDPARYYPHLIVGHDALKKRVGQQDEFAAKHAGKLEVPSRPFCLRMRLISYLRNSSHQYKHYHHNITSTLHFASLRLNILKQSSPLGYCVSSLAYIHSHLHTAHHFEGKKTNSGFRLSVC